MTAHTKYRCVERYSHDTSFCPYCDGGLFLCSVCRCAEGTLPSECPGSPVDGNTQDDIFTGKLDFKGGQWITLEPKTVTP